jgi:hypothetical protein
MNVVIRAGTVVTAVLAMSLCGCGQAAASPALTSAPPAAAIATSPAPPATSAPTDPPPGSAPGCTADEVTATASTDRPTYRSGEQVTLRTTLANHSAQACSIDVSPRDPAFSVSQGGGGEVWRSCGPGQSCPLYERVVVLPAGGSRTETTAWNQHTCDASACQGPPPPTGTYRETATWGGLGSATAPFTVG